MFVPAPIIGHLKEYDGQKMQQRTAMALWVRRPGPPTMIVFTWSPISTSLAGRRSRRKTAEADQRQPARL